ncbi:STY4851/ECs_5259 family protein [Ensifer sp. ENS11]|uniref:STY4851/ECs_5259 family protein n=1 Tax=Ensifer sp. ENS11 TaxID=2769291 RepID=UPI001AEEFAE3|nr:STY4851/ECs_5259 family protein [Ensifer sp. ENS11]
MRLWQYTDQALRAEFERSRGNLSRLAEISEVLKARETDAALELHWQVVAELRKLRKTMPVSKPSDPVVRWLSTYLFKRALKAPDGRQLHRYRMTDTEYLEAQELLRTSKARILREDGSAAALFVVFCAEWFRRESTTLFLKWDALNLDVLTNVPHDVRRHLSEQGLKYWKRPLLRFDGGREFLLSLAVEGGISAHVIADGGSSWLSDYLRNIMRFSLMDANADHVKGFAHDMSWMVRKSYRQEGFVDLCTELVLTLVDWRRTVETAPAGVDPVAFLDAQSPEWKSTLPIFIPTNDEQIARRLLGGLLVEKAEAGTAGSGVGAERYLVLDGDVWRPALLLKARGDIPAGKLPCVSSKGRWKAGPSGKLADFLPSQVALFEPPTEFEKTWRVRPTTPLDRVLVGFEFNQGVVVNLSCGSEVQSFAWPGGSPVVAKIMAFVADGSGDQTAPRRLRLAKTGSASLPAPTVYVLAPADWIATTEEGTAVAETWPAAGKTVVHVVTGTTYFQKPDASIGERYRIEAGKDERQESLALSAADTSLLQPADEIEIFEGLVTIEISSQTGVRQIRPNEVLIRQPGGSWTPVKERRLSRLGVFDISWRDPIADIQLERRRIAIVPVGARLHGRMTSATEAQIIQENFDGWSIGLGSGDIAARNVRDGEYRLSFAGRPRYRVEAVLRAPEGQPFKVSVPIKSRLASVISSDGEIVQPGQEIDVTVLRGAIAESSSKATLTLTPRNERSSSLQFSFTGEIPLSVLKPVVEELMARISDQDAVLDMDFIGDARTSIRLKRYRYPSLRYRDGLVVLDRTLPSDPVVRMILRPTEEHALNSHGDGTFALPHFCEGPCLIYVRDGPDVVSRPLLVILPASEANGSVLRTALFSPDTKSRTTAFTEALAEFEAGTLAAEDVKYLLDLASNLNGLPAAAFDVLKVMARRPQSLLRLLFKAKDDAQRQAIWGLQDQLPFLWLALPSKAWRDTLVSERDEFERALSFVSLPPEKLVELLAGHFQSLRIALLSIEPALTAVLDATRAQLQPALDIVLMEYVRDQHLYDDEAADRKVGRNPVLELLSQSSIRLPVEFDNHSVAEFEGIAVPAFLAAAATGKIASSSLSDIVVRRTLREHGRYISFAYPHLLRFYEALS